MLVRRIFFYIFLVIGLTACNRDSENYQAILPSPDFDIHLYFELYRGYPYYMAYFEDQRIFDWSVMGFNLNEEVSLDREMQRLDPDEVLNPVEVMPDTMDFFSDRSYNSLIVYLASANNRAAGYTIEFRTFKNGFAFRYHLFPELNPESVFSKEITEFALTQRKQFSLADKSDGTSAIAVNEYDLPVRFLSNQKEDIEISELNGEHPYRMQLIQKKEKPNVFLTSVKRSESVEAYPNDSHSTPWRIVWVIKSDSTIVSQ